MAFARFFDKAALSAAAILQGFNYDAFKAELSSELVGVAFDTASAKSQEACWTLDLLINLLARLYPQLCLVRCDNSPATRELEGALDRKAKEINPAIQIVGIDNSPPGGVPVAVVVVVGGSVPPPELQPRCVIYAGSEGWEVRIGGDRPWGAGAGRQPFASGAAACVAAATLFRRIFDSQLWGSSEGPPRSEKMGTYEPPVILSLLTLTLGEPARASDPISEYASSELSTVDLGEVFLVGIGAIGNAAVWALARAPDISGKLFLIDGERVELSNLQRYVLADDAAEGQLKVSLAAEEFVSVTPIGSRRISVEGISARWHEFVDERADYHFDRVLLALDSAEDRVAAQSSLPRWIANAWTQPENLGISRHPEFASGACVACLYMPAGAGKSHEQLVAEALRAETDQERSEVKRLLHLGTPVGEVFVRTIAAKFGVRAEELLPFANKDLNTFFLEAVCGGLVLRLGGSVGLPKAVIVPMAFQSALAGILLAAEVVLSAMGVRPSNFAGRTEIDLRKPLAGRLNSPTAKHESGRCLCQDSVYIAAYSAKYSQADPAASAR